MARQFGKTRLTFEQWKKEVDIALLAKCAMDSECLPDWGYRDAYDDGINPRTAASLALRAAKDY
jgi:hypothetical protein